MFKQKLATVFSFTQTNQTQEKITNEFQLTPIEMSLVVQDSEIPENIFDLYDSEYEQQDTFSTEEVVENIFSATEFQAKDLITYGSINKTFRTVSEKDDFWKPFVEKQYLEYPKFKINSNSSLKNQYYSILSKRNPLKYPSLEIQKKIKKSTENISPQDFYYIPIEQIKIKEEVFDSITWSKDNTIESATLEKLVENLTSHSYFDQHFLHTFIITFRSFTDCEYFFDLLIERYNIPPPLFCNSNDDFLKFKFEKLDKIRLRVTQTLKFWIENFYVFDFDEKMKIKFDEFLYSIEKIKGGIAHKKILINSLEKAKLKFDSSIESKSSISNLYPPIEKPKYQFFGKKNLFSNSVLNWPSIEIARQITKINFDIFQSIEPKECLNQNWNNPETNINSMIQHFNQLSSWISNQIVDTDNLKQRILIVEKFIDISDKLWNLNNFNGLFSVFSALNSSSIFRLKKTFEGISEESKKKFQYLHQQTSPSGAFSNMRSRLISVKPPCIPYVGVYLTDLTFIQDGHPKYQNGKINFVKCLQFAKVIREIQTYQNTKYYFHDVPSLVEYLKSFNGLKSDEELYQKSLVIEPREPKKTKKTKTQINQ
eukprot:gene3929-7139_t